MFHRLPRLAVATLAPGLALTLAVSLALSVALGLGGCVVPAMRPMRATPGLAATVAGGLMTGAEDERACYEGCDAEPVTSVASPVADVRHGWMLAPELGATAGLHLFGGPHVAKTRGWRSLAMAYGQVSWQSDLASAALGLDFGANVIAPVAGVDVQPWGQGLWHPNLAVYARRAQPFVSAGDSSANDVRVRVASWDAGVTLRITPLMAQYSYYRQAEGVADFPAGIEGSLQARAWHVILVGLDIPLGPRAARRPPSP
jgi:hypothetical protein